MTAKELRTKYLDFFKSKGHSVIPSASLIPENDPTVLFTTAGMHPLVPYLMGEKHPEGNKLTDVQKCIRTGDIDEVGNTTHHTFFEMLGNWSLGDYFKEEAIKMSWEFLTEILKLDKNRIAVSVFAGDDDAPFDETAFNAWKNLGIAEERIAKLPKKNNWWGPAGETGPCGPDTEMFYWIGDEDKIPASFNDDNDQWVEIWNDVFMEYNKTKTGKYEPLKQKNVDTGMGLERTLAVMNNLDDNYQSKLWLPIIEKIEELSGKKYGEDEDITRSMRIIADHLRASTFIMADDAGIAPSNVNQGYVLRKLIRRAIRHSKIVGINIEGPFTNKIGRVVIKHMGSIYPELEQNKNKVLQSLAVEEYKFSMTLEKGLNILNKKLEAQIGVREQSYEPQEVRLIHGSGDIKIWDNPPTIVTGKWLFDFYQTFGFPLELTIEELKKRNYYFSNADIKKLYKKFEEEMKKHSELSRTASAGQFKGGLADASEETKKLHTTAHLMLEALRRVLGDHVQQKGSNITPERLRFDFSHGDKMTDEQVKEVEDIVNEQIKKDLPVTVEEMTVEEAKKLGATGVFESKYGERVKVYSVGDFSKEICGGPHVEHIGELGKFKIKKEQSSSAGVRRIKAVLE